MVLWTRQFLEGQGYQITDNIVYQDNQSAMLLEKNGVQSSSKRTRHLDIRYFFVTDHIQGDQLTMEYCPTGKMWAIYQAIAGSTLHQVQEAHTQLAGVVITAGIPLVTTGVCWK